MSLVSPTKPKRGMAAFTLIEVLVSLSVFAVVTLLAYRGLDSMTSAKARLDHEMRMWRELELVFERIGLDITQVAPRSWKDTNGKVRSAIQASNSTSGSQCQLDVLRFGSDHEPVHARYILKDSKLTLEIIADTTWSAVAQKATAISKPNLLLDQVERCDLAFLDNNNQWLALWPAKDLADSTRPRGMRLRLTLAGRGQFERMYYLP
ncbi:MAG: hypothetical protein H6R19_2190 [Proteobacteria bacterium]|jgi:general secretion pathway protein J|nr:hypothetical protein [Pseudomonadota bacterium]